MRRYLLSEGAIKDLFMLSIAEVTPKTMTMFLSEMSFNLRNCGTNQKLAEAFGNDHKRQLIIKSYFDNSFYGFKHCRAVCRRALEIISRAPGLMQFNQDLYKLSELEQRQLLCWAAVLHDFAKFAGSKKSHEAPGALIAQAGFQQLRKELWHGLTLMIMHHDFFCAMVDQHEMPSILRTYPLAEVLRLADRTSLPPEKEILRWWKYGRYFKTRLFDPGLKDEVRFTFSKPARADQLTYFLMVFALQSGDFFHSENQKLFQDWAEKRGRAYGQIARIFSKTGLGADNLMRMHEIMENFHVTKGFELPKFELPK